MNFNVSLLRLLFVAALLVGLSPSRGLAQVITIEGSLTITPMAPTAPIPPAVAPPAVVPPVVPPTVIVDPPAPVLAPVPQAAAPVMAPVVSPAYAPAYAPAAAPAASAAYEPPVAARPRARRHWGLVGAGAGMAIGAYALNIGGTLLAMMWPFSNGHRDQLLLSSFVPVAGPLVQIAFRDEDWQIPFYVVSSALQIAGFAMAFAGTFMRSEEDPAAASITVLPYASSDGMGITAGGRF